VKRRQIAGPSCRAAKRAGDMPSAMRNMAMKALRLS
jgi:hypothetical protein